MSLSAWFSITFHIARGFGNKLGLPSNVLQLKTRGSLTATGPHNILQGRPKSLALHQGHLSEGHTQKDGAMLHWTIAHHKNHQSLVDQIPTTFFYESPSYVPHISGKTCFREPLVPSG